MKSLPSLFILLLLSGSVVHGAPSPYVGEQTREIKALSTDEISGYLAGRGMGLARPAELNGYPGPRHVLDSATELQLTPAQAGALNNVFADMKASAIPLGKRLVAAEADLDRLFTSKQATDVRVRELTVEIGRLQGELRAVHLNAHLATVKLLTPGQIESYNHLRGYDAATPAEHTHNHGNHGSP